MTTTNVPTAARVTTYKNINNLVEVFARVNRSSDGLVPMYETIYTIELMVNNECHVYYKKTKGRKHS